MADLIYDSCTGFHEQFWVWLWLTMWPVTCWKVTARLSLVPAVASTCCGQRSFWASRLMAACRTKEMYGSCRTKEMFQHEEVLWHS